MVCDWGLFPTADAVKFFFELACFGWRIFIEFQTAKSHNEVARVSANFSKSTVYFEINAAFSLVADQSLHDLAGSASIS